MKTLLTTIAVAIAFALAVAANANEVAINQNLQTGDKCIEINLSKTLTNQFGLFAYANQSQGWSEVYAGPTYAPVAWMQVGIAAGIESNQPSTRFGGFVWAGKGRTSLLVLAEDGGSGKWYRFEEKYQIDTKTTIGALQEINAGTGLLVERKLAAGVTLRLRLYDGGKGDAGLKLAF